jgi:hypothetical protein
MTSNKIIFSGIVKLTDEYMSREMVRIVSGDSVKFSDVTLVFEIYSGTDSLGNEQWRRADMSEETRILKHLGRLYITQCQDQTFRENK